MILNNVFFFVSGELTWWINAKVGKEQVSKKSATVERFRLEQNEKFDYLVKTQRQT